ncbi:hypothetical protein [Nocardia fluminea]|uniref:hypothetical protein n=1 Tax=Nocardia fluminea TaxID=134984 RepID=UPI0033DFEBE5
MVDRVVEREDLGMVVDTHGEAAYVVGPEECPALVDSEFFDIRVVASHFFAFLS